MSDVALSQTIGVFVQHHRLNQNRSQEEVANAAGISRSTLSLLERGEKVTLSTLLQVLRVLDLLYVMDVFKVDHSISPLEYARLQKQARKKATGKRKDQEHKTDLGW
ncbi:helix-turn-helix domain-containing protein [Reichenbachiella ulvae]|uniref:Helix-turn-helix transcriptional regulator n=1 Tax=Reichenbachiella ulvae TaxID=2980104 RepID=A0ABT3CUW0_9BACT|nr:helix-turn-helix transcriptional regulator [Reichenbachiella ulvae]MCV9387485.1 helix-turn-helix transcriptional regulator [Reichenbachiella ulvae]